MKPTVIAVLLASVLGVAPTPVRASEVTVFAAASLSEAVGEVARAFEASTGHKVVTSFGPSSFLAKQIKAGAGADLFFSADAAQVAGLIAQKLVRPEDRIDLLSNALVVVVPAASQVQLRTPSDVAGVKRLALADPEGVPAGVYARQWLQSAGVWDAAQPHVIPLLDVRATLAAVASENADAGIVYKTDAAVSKKVKVAFEVPREKGPSIVYPLALMAASKSEAARDALAFFAAAPAREIYARRGFVVLPAR